MVLHNAFGILLCEQVFGAAITNSAGRRVFIRDIGVQHVLEDLGCVPTLSECLAELPLRPWMGGARLARQQNQTGWEPEVANESGPTRDGDTLVGSTRHPVEPGERVDSRAGHEL